MNWELQLASMFLFLLEKFTLNVLPPLLSVLTWCHNMLGSMVHCRMMQLGLFIHHVSVPSIWTHIVVIMLAFTLQPQKIRIWSCSFLSPNHFLTLCLLNSFTTIQRYSCCMRDSIPQNSAAYRWKLPQPNTLLDADFAWI